jgi:Family of unknown function (DUF5336)
MSSYDSPTRGSASASNRERLLSMVAGGLGVLMFVWGFLKWLSLNDNGHEQKYAGFAFAMPTTAVIGLSLAAGLMALLGAADRRSGRGVPSAIPTALAATSLLLAIGILIAKDNVSPEVTDDVNVEIGLILALITAIVQTVVLALGLASRKEDAANTGTSTQTGQPTGYPTQHSGYAGQPTGYAGQPGGYAAQPTAQPAAHPGGYGTSAQPGQPGGTGYPPAQ